MGRDVLIIKKTRSSVFRFSFALLGVILLSSNPSHSSEKISLSCIWTVWTHNTESFLIDLEKKKVLWVEEENLLNIDELTDGFIKFNGIKSSMKGNGGVSIQGVELSFKINRINGRFDVISEKVKTDRDGKCVKGKIF